MYSFLFVFADKSAVVCAASKADTGDAVTSTAFSVVLKSIIVSLLLDSSMLLIVFLPTGLDEENPQNAKPGLTLKHVTEGVNQSDIRLMCRANTVSNIAEFKWEVIQPVCRLQTPLLNSTEAGVLIIESSSVRSSTLEITDYRERGYGGSTIVCKATSADDSSTSYSANFTVQGCIITNIMTDVSKVCMSKLTDVITHYPPNTTISKTKHNVFNS